MDAATATIIGTITGAIIGAILTGPVTYYFSKNLMKKQEFNKATAKFRASFVEAQRKLDENKSFELLNPNGKKVKDILEEFIIDHERAKIIFRTYLSAEILSSFDKAWNEYYSQENRNAECLSDYKSVWNDHGINLKEENNIRKLALSRIEKLLSYTELE